MSDASSLVVIGGGVAGTAAAWFAAKSGSSVSCVFEHGGASALASGALASGVNIDLHLRAFSDALGLWALDAETRVATPSGAVLSVAGRDLSLLDLHACAGKRVAVLGVARPGWDAPWLARSLNDAVGAAGAHFEARAVPELFDVAETHFGDVDLAMRLDEPERQRRFTDVLRAASDGVDAWLTGPWLGTRSETAATLGQALGLPIGEVSSPVGGVAGVRWERARDALLAKVSVRVLRDTVRQIARTTGRRWCLDLASHSVENPVLEASAVVLAIGGIAGGGIRMNGDLGSPSFVSSVDVSLDVAFGDFHKGRVAVPGSPDLERDGAAMLERVGIRSTDALRLEALGLAGDVVFDAPRDVLSAAASGIRAAVASRGGRVQSDAP